MPKFRSSLLLVALLLLSTARPASAGWGDWFPFTTTTTTREPMIDGRPLHPTYTSNSKTSPQKSLWTRMSNGTQSFFRGTRDLFTGERPETKTPQRSNWSSHDSSSKTQKSGGWFGSMFQAKEEPKEPGHPQDWISQDRPSMF